MEKWLVPQGLYAYIQESADYSEEYLEAFEVEKSLYDRHGWHEAEARERIADKFNSRS